MTHIQSNSNIFKYAFLFIQLINNKFLSLYLHVIKYAVQEIAELEKILNQQRGDNNALNAVCLDELETMMQNDDVLLLDVRPEIEYEFGHITGAVSIPMNELMAKLIDISKDKEIIAYCRGPFCVLADEAVKLLNEKGYNVRRLDEGYQEWEIMEFEKTNQNNELYKKDCLIKN